jgi:hypothetical protein
MKKVTALISLILLCDFYANAAYNDVKGIPSAFDVFLKGEFSRTKTNYRSSIADTSKFACAELIYQDSYGAIKPA